jgi:hypothetical protein
LNNPLGWAALQPFIRASDALYRRELPEVYARQMEAVKRADPRWVIPRTAFTTMTVNRDAVFPAHRDSGNLPGTFAAMSAIHAGTYDGFYLVFPKYKVAVDLRSRDVLLADVSEVHGNSPVQAKGAWTRVSTVLYFRSGFLP